MNPDDSAACLPAWRVPVCTVFPFFPNPKENHMKKIVLPFALLAFGTGAVHAEMQPGLWEITMTMDMPGLVIPPMKHKVCLSPEDVAGGEATIPKDDQSGCAVVDYSLKGNIATWSMNCPDMSGKGHMTYSSDSYSGSTELKMDVDGQIQEMKQTYTGKRLGDCQK
jgi:hypothetical protein